MRWTSSRATWRRLACPARSVSLLLHLSLARTLCPVLSLALLAFPLRASPLHLVSLTPSLLHSLDPLKLPLSLAIGPSSPSIVLRDIHCQALVGTRKRKNTSLNLLPLSDQHRKFSLWFSKKLHLFFISYLACDPRLILLSIHRYSLPSNNFNGQLRSNIGGFNSGSGMDSFAAAKYLFHDDDKAPLNEEERLSTPDIKSYIKLTEPDDKFPTLSRRDGSNIVSLLLLCLRTLPEFSNWCLSCRRTRTPLISQTPAHRARTRTTSTTVTALLTRVCPRMSRG